MKQSQLFSKTLKQVSKDETSLNAQLLLRGGFVDKLTAGVYTYLPLGLRVINKIEGIVRKEINEIGGQEVLMPALTPKEIWQTTNRWDNFDALYKLKGHDEKDYALGATHEEVVTPLVARYVQSYRDLPTYVYQIQTKFRNEPRAKAGLLRGKEFIMKDLYSFHKTAEDLDSYYEKATEAYNNIYKKLGLSEQTYYTYALGGSFSKYSHEFQTVSESGEDLIYICDKCKVAHNKEVIEVDGEKCVSCGGIKFEQKKSIEVGNIFKLQTKFSAPFDFNFTDESGKKSPVVMGCYGIGISRLMGTLVEIYNDAGGIIWPESVAPFRVHLLSFGEEVEVKELSEDLYKKLNELGIDVLHDDRDETLGVKLKDSDLIGIPNRVVVSPRSLKAGGLEVSKRGTEGSNIMSVGEFINSLAKNV